MYKRQLEKREYNADKKTGKVDNEIGDQIIRKHENTEKVCIVLKCCKTSNFIKLIDFILLSGGMDERTLEKLCFLSSKLNMIKRIVVHFCKKMWYNTKADCKRRNCKNGQQSFFRHDQ